MRVMIRCLVLAVLAAFLLRPGELREAFAELGVQGFEEGRVDTPKPACIQRLCATKGVPR